MRIYLDTCCLNRPFNDQTQDRIRLETEAITLVLDRVQAGEWQWVSSEAVAYEVSRISDPFRRGHIEALFQHVSVEIGVDDATSARMRELEELHFDALDALHIACAESGSADVLLTTDDRFQRRAAREAARLRVRVDNPLRWLQEVIGL